ncbi:MAG: acyl-CoA dehydratase activase [Candidatus Cloacimonetes bacterium]|nr:acyl-CoA dehydratase activase [Candidatus Cloacimonadota bacterium]
MQNLFSIGIDSGSRTAKIVVINNENKQIICSDVTDSGVNPQETCFRLFRSVLEKSNITENEIENIFSTGYGRNIVDFSHKRIPEISCHARGVRYFFPYVRTVIDIGGQDSKVIAIDESGKVADFAMNDKCAAGTGRFLEVTATILETTVDKLSITESQADKELQISSTCVVFAESEIISLISAGEKPANIIRAVNYSIAKRIKNLLTKISVIQPIVFTGGVALNESLAKAIQNEVGQEIQIPAIPSITGALGAALLNK